jgi:hypothetical protein
VYDDRYDLEETITANPARAKVAYVHTVTCPNGHTQTISINHKTEDGARFAAATSIAIARRVSLSIIHCFITPMGNSVVGGPVMWALQKPVQDF